MTKAPAVHPEKSHGPEPPRTGAAEAKRAEAERKAIAEAEKIVAIWNARQSSGRALWFHPTTRDHQQVTNAPARRDFFVPRQTS